MQKILVLSDEKGISLGQLLKRRLNRPLRSIKRDLERNSCRLNGKLERFASKRVSGGDLVEFSSQELLVEEARILFEGDGLVAFYKPAGVIWEEVVGDLLPVHRIDRDTSGVLLAACTVEAQEKIIADWSHVEKRYLAWVVGEPAQDKWAVENRLAVKGTFHGQKLWGAAPIGRWARTRFEVLKREGEKSLIACFPETGRTHQIRVHLAEGGLPIIGDGQYGRHASITAARHLLHAHRLKFRDIEIEAPLAGDFPT